MQRLSLLLVILLLFLTAWGCAAGSSPTATPVVETERVSSLQGKTPTVALTATPTPEQREPTPTPTATPNLAIANRWQHLGPIQNANISAIAVSPEYANDGTFFVGTLTNTGILSAPLGTSIVTGGVYRTRDGGLSWREVSITLSKWGITALAVSPDFARDKTIFAGTYGLFPGSAGNPNSTDARLSRSRDAGLNWNPAQTDLPNQQINALAFSPDYVNDRTVFVALGSLNQQRLSPPRGWVYKSTNGGARWLPAGYGLPPDLAATAIGFSPNYSQDGIIFASTVYGGDQPSERGGVLRSQDKGLNWLSMAPGVPREFAHAKNFAVSPNYAEDFTIFAAAGACCGDVKGIYKSVNGGATWKPAFTGVDDYVEAVVISPKFATDNTVYATTRNAGVFKSANAGLSWVAINEGLSSYETTEIALIPAESPILLVGIKDKGLWRYVDKR